MIGVNNLYEPLTRKYARNINSEKNIRRLIHIENCIQNKIQLTINNIVSVPCLFENARVYRRSLAFSDYMCQAYKSTINL